MHDFWPTGQSAYLLISGQSPLIWRSRCGLPTLMQPEELLACYRRLTATAMTLVRRKQGGLPGATRPERVLDAAIETLPLLLAQAVDIGPEAD